MASQGIRGMRVARKTSSGLVINLLALSLLVGGSIAAAVPAYAKGSAQSKMDLAELMFFNGNIDGAIRAYKQALAMEPDMVQCHMGLLSLYIQKQDFAKAIEECHEVIRLKPNTKDVHLILGNLLRAQNDLDGSIEALTKAAESGSDPGQVHSALGTAHLQKGNLEKAEEHLAHAVEKSPKGSADAHLLLGVVKFKKGNKAEAISHIDHSIKMKAKNPEAHNAKGDMLAADGKWKEALEEYELAVKDEPKFALAHASMGNAHLQLGDNEKAMEHFKKARDLNPSDKNVLYALPILLEKAGKINEALVEFENSLMLETDATMASQIRMHMSQLRGQSGLSQDLFQYNPAVGAGQNNLFQGLGTLKFETPKSMPLQPKKKPPTASSGKEQTAQ